MENDSITTSFKEDFEQVFVYDTDQKCVRVVRARRTADGNARRFVSFEEEHNTETSRRPPVTLLGRLMRTMCRKPTRDSSTSVAP